MALPLLLGLGGTALGGAGLLGGLGALGAGAIGSGLGTYLQTGDLGKGIQTGLLSYFGGKALGSAFGGPTGTEAAQAGLDSAAQQASQAAMNPADLQAAAGGIGNLSNAQAVAQANQLASQAASAQQAAKAGPSFFQGLKSDPTAAMTAKGDLTAGFTGSNLPFTAAGLGTAALAGSDILAPKGLEPLGTGSGGGAPEAEAAVYKQRRPGEGYRGGIDDEFKFFDSNMSSLATGGLASLSYQEGGMMPEANDKELISRAVEAIEGRTESPEIALAAFVARYGEEALRDLVGRVQRGEFAQDAMVDEGMLSGVGDGMDDMIPATLEGQQDVVLSDGEFIVPADVVSGLGNGSSDAGSDALYEMMDRVRKLRTGKEEQPKQVPQEKMLPV